MLNVILIVVAVAAVLLVVIVATRPDHFRVERTVTISAPVEIVFAQVNNLHKWNAWSPWAKLDLAARYSFEGPPEGKGAVMRWAGNCKVGEGSMAIIDSRPGELIRFQLEFLKPFKASNIAEFAFQPAGDQTSVRWSMTGKPNFMMKAVGLFMNCDAMVGRQFEEGLANLGRVAETSVAKQPI